MHCTPHTHTLTHTPPKFAHTHTPRFFRRSVFHMLSLSTRKRFSDLRDSTHEYTHNTIQQNTTHHKIIQYTTTQHNNTQHATHPRYTEDNDTHTQHTHTQYTHAHHTHRPERALTTLSSRQAMRNGERTSTTPLWLCRSKRKHTNTHTHTYTAHTQTHIHGCSQCPRWRRTTCARWLLCQQAGCHQRRDTQLNFLTARCWENALDTTYTHTQHTRTHIHMDTTRISKTRSSISAQHPTHRVMGLKHVVINSEQAELNTSTTTNTDNCNDTSLTVRVLPPMQTDAST